MDFTKEDVEALGSLKGSMSYLKEQVTAIHTVLARIESKLNKTTNDIFHNKNRIENIEKKISEFEYKLKNNEEKQELQRKETKSLIWKIPTFLISIITLCGLLYEIIKFLIRIS